MKQSTSENIPPVFGKYQPYIGQFYFQLVYVIWFICNIHFVYAIIKLQYPVIFFYISLMFLQTFVTKSPRYIYFVTHIIQARSGLRQARIIYQQEIGDDQKCAFGFHPHGVFASSVLAFMNYKEGPFKHMAGLSSRFMLNLPVVGLFLRLWGVQSVDPKTMKKLLKKGVNIGVVPGGFQEATLTVQDELRIYIKNRKGFIKYALEHNYGIYPILAVHQHKFFWTFRYFLNFRLWLNKFKLPAVLFWSKKGGVLLPYDARFVCVIGRAIKGRIYGPDEKPSSQEINSAHAAYIEQIQRMHQKHKDLSQVPLRFF